MFVIISEILTQLAAMFCPNISTCKQHDGNGSSYST
jgi:hypothetical protein